MCWQFYKFHFLVLSSFGLDRIRVDPQVFRVMDARVHGPFYRGLSSSKRVRYWPFKRINYQQLHRIADKVQSEDLERHELRFLSTYSEKKKETRSTPIGPIFGDLSLSRIKGEKWPSADGHGPSDNWYLSLSFNPFVVHRYGTFVVLVVCRTPSLLTPDGGYLRTGPRPLWVSKLSD